MSSDEEVDAEAARLEKLLNKKSKERFEQKRQETLEKYQMKSGQSTSFHLSSDSSSSATSDFFKLSDDTKDTDSGTPVAYKPVVEHKAEYHTIGSQYSSPSTSSSSAPSSSAQSFSKPQPAAPQAQPAQKLDWREVQAMKEREKLEREEEERRRKAEKLGEFKSGSDAASGKNWREIQAEKEAKRKELEREREAARLQNVRSISDEAERKLREFTLAQAKEEEEFKKQRELEERKKYEASHNLVDCSVCGCKVEAAKATKGPKENQFYCPAHKPFPKGPVCAACHEPIGLSSWIKARNSKYHPECLVCAGCKKQLKGGMRTAWGKMWCLDCKPANVL